MPTCNLGPCWTASPFDGTNFDTLSATTFNNRWIVGGQNNTNGGVVIQYSSDGINWTRVEVGYAGGGGVKSFASGNGILIGIVNFFYHVQSVDGINWTIVSHWPPVSGEVGLAFGAGNFVLTVNSADQFAYSPNGQAGTWNITNCAPFTFGYMDRARIYGAGLFVSVGTQGFGVTSSVNTPITAINYPVGGPAAGEVAYGGGAFIAFTGTRSVYRSLDGYNWTLLVDVLPIAPDGAIDYWRSIIYSQGYFLCCRLDSKYLAYSPDGITWTLTADDHLFDSPLNNGYGILGTDGNGQYIAVRTTGNILQVGVCPCSTPITYGEYWASLSNVVVSNVSIRKAAKQNQFYTSVLYPEELEDNIGIQSATVNSILTWEILNDTMSVAVPTVTTATLVDTIVYKTYNDAVPDVMSVTVPAIQSGTLVDTIVYKTYDNAVPDVMSVGVPTISTGTLVTTIAYVSYDNAVSDVMSVGVPTIIGATLI